MGTRSLTYIYDDLKAKRNEALCCFYRQMDGYLTGHGKDLAEFLAPMQLCNGYGSAQETGTWANGAGCLAAQMIAHFKTDIGGIYMQRPLTRVDAGQEFTYRIYADVDDGQIRFDAFVNRWKLAEKRIFSGTPAQFLIDLPELNERLND